MVQENGLCYAHQEAQLWCTLHPNEAEDSIPNYGRSLCYDGGKDWAIPPGLPPSPPPIPTLTLNPKP